MQDEYSPQVLMDFTESEMIVTWIGRVHKKKLIYNTDTCVGCGLCVEVCPSGALSLGPIPQIATGKMDGKFAKVIFDQEKCRFCGLCATVCPTNSISFEIDGKRLEEYGEYPKIRGTIEVDSNKCIPCKICEVVCPVDCIEVRIDIKKKDELVKYEKKPEKIEGEIKIDRDRCTFCGICAEMCDAIKISWKDPDPSDLSFASVIEVDLSKCDFCGLCAEICPDKAIEVKCFTPVERKIEKPSIGGKVVVDESSCLYCGWCSSVCPREAITVRKRFQGRIKLFHLEKCDPLGCKACINICPVHCWYVPKDVEREGKIAVNEDLCIYCRACEKACPENIIKVEITEVNFVDAERQTIWNSSWKNTVLESIVERKRKIPQRYIEIEMERHIVSEERPAIPEVPEKVKLEMERRLELLKKHLLRIRVRRLMERGEAMKLSEF